MFLKLLVLVFALISHMSVSLDVYVQLRGRTKGKEERYVPFSANRLLLCASSPFSPSSLNTVWSLLVFAKSNIIGLSKSSKPLTSSIAFVALFTSSNTTKACPLALRLDLATRSTMLPYSEKISVRASMSCGGFIRSSRLRTCGTGYALGDRE